MPVDYLEHPDAGLAELAVSGRVTEADFDAVAPRLAAFVEARGEPVRLLEIVSDFEGFDLALIRKGIAFDVKYLSRFSHCAVVTDSGWIGPFARLASPFISCQVRTFPLGEEAAARAWLATA